jgi:hypothetical protein
LAEVIRHHPPGRFVNVDETHWNLGAGRFLMWAKSDHESIQCMIENNDKQRITAITGIDYAGNKLPLIVIGKVKTPRCLT